MNYNPLVTIVIPVYNGANFVAQAIESALNQTYKNLEILVINDGSPDNSEEIIMPYTDRVTYIKKENGGVSTVLNTAIEKMNGQWLSWLSHDDLYTPEKISKQVMKLNELIAVNGEENIETFVLSCQDKRIDENGSFLPRGGTVHPEYSDNYELIAKEVANYTIGGCTVLASRRAYKSVGGFDEKNRTISDADMWFKLMSNGFTFVFDNEPLVLSRYHKNMVSVKRSDLVEIEKDNFYTKTIKHIAPKIKNNLLFDIAISMERLSLPEATETAFSLYNGDKKKLKLALFNAKLLKNIRKILRTIYRKIKWG